MSYSSDPQEVKAILLDLAAQHPDVLHDPLPEVIFSDLGDSSLIFLLRIWTAKELGNPQALKSDLYFSFFDAFREHGIEMLFSRLDLHLRTVDASIINTLPNKSILRNGQHNSSIKPETANR